MNIKEKDIYCLLIGSESEEEDKPIKIVLTEKDLFLSRVFLGEKQKISIAVNRIDKISFDFDMHIVVLNVDDEGYAVKIFTEESNLRNLCKKFKKLKKNVSVLMHNDLFLSKIATPILDDKFIQPKVDNVDTEVQDTNKGIVEDNKLHINMSDIANKDSLFDNTEKKKAPKKRRLFSRE